MIIPAYNEERYLLKTLVAIKTATEHSDFPLKIIVVNNESTNKTAKIPAGFDTVVITEAEHNIGKVGSGAKLASGEVFIFVNKASIFIILSKLKWHCICSLSISIK